MADVETVEVPRATLEDLNRHLERCLNAVVTIQGLCGLVDEDSWETCAEAIYYASEAASVTEALEAVRPLIGKNDHG